MMAIKEFRLRRYMDRSWVVEEWYRLSKKKDKWGWKAVAYPGTLEQAINRLLMMSTPRNLSGKLFLNYPESLIPGPLRGANHKIDITLPVDELTALKQAVQKAKDEILMCAEEIFCVT